MIDQSPNDWFLKVLVINILEKRLKSQFQIYKLEDQFIVQGGPLPVINGVLSPISRVKIGWNISRTPGKAIYFRPLIGLPGYPYHSTYITGFWAHLVFPLYFAHSTNRIHITIRSYEDGTRWDGFFELLIGFGDAWPWKGFQCWTKVWKQTCKG